MSKLPRDTISRFIWKVLFLIYSRQNNEDFAGYEILCPVTADVNFIMYTYCILQISCKEQ